VGAWLGTRLLNERFATSRLLGAAAIVGGVVLLSLPD
jgi:drug/metabolite transporter (DMT)-like permease